MATIRKCSICKKSIDISNGDEDFFVETKGKVNLYTHSDCYIQYHTSQKKRGLKTVEECELYIDECKFQQQSMVRSKNIKDELYQFIFEMYNVSYFPKYFYIKMDSIFKGTYSKLNRPVSPEDLLDMWKQKKDYLNRVAEQNRIKRNEIDGINRVNYDLAILLGRYDSYLKWREQQKMALADMEEQRKRDVNKITYNNIVRPRQQIKKSEAIDIGSIVDEI